VERRRLQVLERLRDPLTVRRLRRLGVTAGWRCLEVGVGAGSIVRWLSDAVGPTGQVLAIDIDIRLLRGLDAANVEVRVQDLLGEHWGLAGFDLVHVRAVLHHLPRRQKQAIARLISALRPGGWLLVEEMDFASVVPAGLGGVADVQAFSRVLETHLVVLRTHNGFDSHYGRHLLRDLLAAGLEAVKAEGRASVWRGGGDGMRIWRLTFAQLRDAMVAAGLPGGDVDRAIELCDDPGFAFVAPLVMAASGRRSGR